MALTDKITAIANAIRGKTGGSAKLSLDAMATAISNLKTTFTTQTKTVTLSETQQEITPDSGKDGLSKVTVPGISSTYVGSGVTKQAAKTITPTKSTQTAVASGVYTTGTISVGAIPSQYIVPSGSVDISSNGTVDVTNYASAVVSVSGGGGGFSNLKLLYDDTVSITYTSTSAGTAKSISGITGVASYPFVVCVIENTDTSSGETKFFSSTTSVGNAKYASNAVSLYRYGTMLYYNASSALAYYSSTTYGMWLYTYTAAGAVTIRGRCSTTYCTSLTGTYRVRIYGVEAGV